MVQHTSHVYNADEVLITHIFKSTIISNGHLFLGTLPNHIISVFIMVFLCFLCVVFHGNATLKVCLKNILTWVKVQNFQKPEL